MRGPYDVRMAKKAKKVKTAKKAKLGKPTSETSELIAAAVALIEATKGGNPEAVAVARETYDAVLDRYSLRTEAMRWAMSDSDAPPSS